MLTCTAAYPPFSPYFSSSSGHRSRRARGRGGQHDVCDRDRARLDYRSGGRVAAPVLFPAAGVAAADLRQRQDSRRPLQVRRLSKRQAASGKRRGGGEECVQSPRLTDLPHPLKGLYSSSGITGSKASSTIHGMKPPSRDMSFAADSLTTETSCVALPSPPRAPHPPPLPPVLVRATQGNPAVRRPRVGAAAAPHGACLGGAEEQTRHGLPVVREAAAGGRGCRVPVGAEGQGDAERSSFAAD